MSTVDSKKTSQIGASNTELLQLMPRAPTQLKRQLWGHKIKSVFVPLNRHKMQLKCLCNMTMALT